MNFTLSWRRGKSGGESLTRKTVELQQNCRQWPTAAETSGMTTDWSSAKGTETFRFGLVRSTMCLRKISRSGNLSDTETRTHQYITDREILLASVRALRNNFPNGKHHKVHDIHSITTATWRRPSRCPQASWPDAAATGASLGCRRARFIVDLEARKPTLRLENVLRVIDALGGEIQLSGLPSVTGDDHGA